MTPARLALSTTRLFSSRLIKADLPTLGKPITTARTGRGSIPRSFRFWLMAIPASCAALEMATTPVPL